VDVQEGVVIMSGTTPANPPGVAGAPALVVMPHQPTMGTLVKLSLGLWVLRSGNKPMPDWSGLGASDLDSPMPLRPTYIGDAQKAYKHCSTGLAEKYNESSDLSCFIKEFWRHLVLTGMDTIAHLADPKTTAMMLVVLHHSRFTLTNAMPLAETQVQFLYDSMDKSNNTAATDCLLDSVSPELKKRIRNQIADQAPSLVWLKFLLLTVSSSIDWFEQIKRQIQAHNPSQYAGQDMVKLVGDFSIDSKMLTMAGHYDHSLTLKMLQIFLKAEGDGNEAFRFPLGALYERMETALQEIALKENGPAQVHMEDRASNELPDFNLEEWPRLFGDSTYQFPFKSADLDTMRELFPEYNPHHDEVARAFDAAAICQEAMDSIARQRAAAAPVAPL
jgi:hypothetical protein